MPQKARGLRNPADYGDLSSLSPGQLVGYFVQKHLAERAGPHYDLRIGTPETGLFSWAVPSGLPEPGVKRLAVRQPIHSYDYGKWSGKIPKGYGKGQVESVDNGQVLVTKLEPNKVEFTVAHKRVGDTKRYTLIKPTKGRTHDWLLLNTTPTAGAGIEKLHYQSVPANQIEPLLDNLRQGKGGVQAKIDGASTLIQLLRGQVEAFSYRTSAVSGGPIFHTERLFRGRPRFEDLPTGAERSVLRGEMFATDPSGKALTPQQLGSLLNSSLAKSLERQEAQKTPLRVMLFDLEQWNGVPVDRSTMPYKDRMGILRDIVKATGQTERFLLPDHVESPDEARALYDRVMGGKHPLTDEGLVYHPHLGNPVKLKKGKEHDVFITGTFPGKGKHQGRIGGFTYADTLGGKPIGRVGTGLSDAFRSEVAKDPDSYVGRIARVAAMERLPSGALRQPSFISLHEG